MDREEAKNLLAQMVFGDLPEDQTAQLKQYLQQHPEDEHLLTDMQQTAELLKHAVESQPAPRLNEARRQALFAHVGAQKSHRHDPPHRFRLVFAPGLLAMAASLVLMVVGVVTYQMLLQMQESAPSPYDVALLDEKAERHNESQASPGMPESEADGYSSARMRSATGTNNAGLSSSDTEGTTADAREEFDDAMLEGLAAEPMADVSANQFVDVDALPHSGGLAAGGVSTGESAGESRSGQAYEQGQRQEASRTQSAGKDTMAKAAPAAAAEVQPSLAPVPAPPSEAPTPAPSMALAESPATMQPATAEAQPAQDEAFRRDAEAEVAPEHLSFSSPSAGNARRAKANNETTAGAVSETAPEKPATAFETAKAQLAAGEWPTFSGDAPVTEQFAYAMRGPGAKLKEDADGDVAADQSAAEADAPSDEGKQQSPQLTLETLSRQFAAMLSAPSDTQDLEEKLAQLHGAVEPLAQIEDLQPRAAELLLMIEQAQQLIR